MTEILIAIGKDQFEQICSRLDSIEKQIGQPSKQYSEWVSTKEAKELLGVGTTTLWAMRNRGQIKANRVGRKLYFRRNDLELLIENNQQK